jgi:hypothetical protein
VKGAPANLSPQTIPYLLINSFWSLDDQIERSLNHQYCHCIIKLLLRPKKLGKHSSSTALRFPFRVVDQSVRVFPIPKDLGGKFLPGLSCTWSPVSFLLALPLMPWYDKCHASILLYTSHICTWRVRYPWTCFGPASLEAELSHHFERFQCFDSSSKVG